MPNRRWTATRYLLATMLLATPLAHASPMVFFSVEDGDFGLSQYNLTVDNQGGAEPLSGLLVLNANSLFGVDDTTFVGAPQSIGGDPVASWSFLPPVPPFIDILTYFSLDPLADIPIGARLGGFFFQSALDPSAVIGNGFAVEAIGAISGAEIPLANAILVPEPSSLLLLALGAAVQACLWLRWGSAGWAMRVAGQRATSPGSRKIPPEWVGLSKTAASVPLGMWIESNRDATRSRASSRQERISIRRRD